MLSKETSGQNPDRSEDLENCQPVFFFDPNAEKTVAEHFDATPSVSFVVVVDHEGNEYLYFPDEQRGKIQRASFPINTTAITNYSSVATVSYKGSKCQLIVRNGVGYLKC